VEEEEEEEKKKKKKKEKNKTKPVYNGNLKGQVMFSSLWICQETPHRDRSHATYTRALLCLLGSSRSRVSHLPTQSPTYTPTPSLTLSMAQFG
jgi:hypothetical protein